MIFDHFVQSLQLKLISLVTVSDKSKNPVPEMQGQCVYLSDLVMPL